jgi:hypothetical protein
MTDAQSPAPGDWVVRRVGTVAGTEPPHGVWMLYRDPDDGDAMVGNDLEPLRQKAIAQAKADGVQAWWQPTGGTYQRLQGSNDA